MLFSSIKGIPAAAGIGIRFDYCTKISIPVIPCTKVKKQIELQKK